jgi:hypothetical protein
MEVRPYPFVMLTERSIRTNQGNSNFAQPLKRLTPEELIK